MSDNLRAAAERCRDFAGPGWVDVENASVECVADLLAIARAYLAEYPADDAEPVTEEWLATIGQRWNRSLDFVFGGRGRTVAIECGGRAVPPPERRWYFGNHPMPTRGHVRRLIAALGAA